MSQKGLGRFFGQDGRKRAAPEATSPSDSKRLRDAVVDLDDTPLAALESSPLPVAAPPKATESAVPPQASVAASPTPALSPPSTDAAPDDLGAALHRAQRSGSSFTAECFHHYANGGGQYSWPTWLQPEHLKDSEGRPPSDPAYNQSTLWVPNEQQQKKEGHGTPMLVQLWKVKAAHFDKVALFKVGKFYEIFYYDAFVAQRVCDLKWMNSEKKPHVGFPEMAKHDYARKLVEAGYKVVVVEQVERVAENKQRVAEQKAEKKESGPTCVERKACEVFTKGTVVDPEIVGGAGARFMVYLQFEDGAPSFSACLVDCATSQVYVGRVSDAADRNGLRTMLAQVQPSEVVYDSGNMPSEVLAMIKRLPCRPQLSCLFGGQAPMVAKSRLAQYRLKYPEKLSQAVEAELAHESAAIAAAGAMDYLDTVLLGNRVLPFAIWDLLDSYCAATEAQAGSATPGSGGRLVLDATALSALEVLETLEGTYKGSLLEYLDHTCTSFGHRLLRQWLCAPLRAPDDIRARHAAVRFFAANNALAKELRSGLKKLSDIDLERVTSRVWGYALQSERHAVMYEDITAKRLGEFMRLLQAYEQCVRLMDSIPSVDALPARVAQVARTKANGGCFPELEEIIHRLRGSVVSIPGKKEGTLKYRPRDGVDSTFDAVQRDIAATKQALDQELHNLRAEHPRANLTYVHRLPGYKYEVEGIESMLPSEAIGQHEITYKKQGKVRFHTDKIKKLIAQLDNLEDKSEDCIFPFLAQLFNDFYAHQAKFRAAVRLTSELDALLSLAMASSGLSGQSCVPEIVDVASEAPLSLELRDCRHPVAAARMGAAFVANDTLINAEGVPGVLVVTGPNMGGKSTVLRQTCIAVVMAQLGCCVNASKCRLTPVDRIFTRIGSYDTILEGKSTLLTELEETSAILKHGTRRSLAVLDELGRGTSTFDGAAIAAAVLEELTNHVGCGVLFATHYHPVSREAARSERVAPFHMSASVDEKTETMTFLYKFLPGLCPASSGHNVAKLAGLPAAVLQEARQRSEEFERGGGPADVKGAIEFAPELARLAVAGNEEGLRSAFRARYVQAN